MIFQNLLLLMVCGSMAPESPGSSAEVLTLFSLVCIEVVTLQLLYFQLSLSFFFSFCICEWQFIEIFLFFRCLVDPGILIEERAVMKVHTSEPCPAAVPLR